jgi:hypothetical protein
MYSAGQERQEVAFEQVKQGAVQGTQVWLDKKKPAEHCATQRFDWK